MQDELEKEDVKSVVQDELDKDARRTGESFKDELTRHNPPPHPSCQGNQPEQ